MSDTQTHADVDLEALFEESIPCNGVKHRLAPRECDNPATLAWTNPHGCASIHHKTMLPKCADCWMALYQILATRLAQNGGLRCAYCGHTSRQVLEHTDYRPF